MNLTNFVLAMNIFARRSPVAYCSDHLRRTDARQHHHRHEDGIQAEPTVASPGTVSYPRRKAASQANAVALALHLVAMLRSTWLEHLEFGESLRLLPRLALCRLTRHIRLTTPIGLRFDSCGGRAQSDRALDAFLAFWQFMVPGKSSNSVPLEFWLLVVALALLVPTSRVAGGATRHLWRARRRLAALLPSALLCSTTWAFPSFADDAGLGPSISLWMVPCALLLSRLPRRRSSCSRRARRCRPPAAAWTGGQSLLNHADWQPTPVAERLRHTSISLDFLRRQHLGQRLKPAP